ncbi:MAG: TlyA family RNA methyltransferase [Dehalococcoidia bacterium]|nr:TlyA family RNA methyltransferase [Dehalococcoidia bacterium]
MIVSSKRVTKQRLDNLLVSRGLVGTRSRAQAMVMARSVLVNGELATRPGKLVPEDSVIELVRHMPYVSRGGLKLSHALDEFALDVSGMTAIDVGASTGGFTDCLLQRGARRVYAIDVGYGQLDYRLRRDPRVVPMERVNARYDFKLPEMADLAVVDVSFISLTKVIPRVEVHLRGPRRMVVLLKPQFEGRRQEVGKGGVIRDPQVHARILGRFISWLADNRFALVGLTASLVLGDAGNREFFLTFCKYEREA